MENQTEQMLAEAINKLAASLDKGNGMHTKAPAAFHTATELHGQGSIFGSSPIERDVITAHVRPHGISSMIRSFPSVMELPIYSTLTGYTGPDGDWPTNPCEDAPSGYVKACEITAPFGRVPYDTKTIEIDKVMLRANRGDFVDLRLRGEVLAGLGPFTPGGMNQNDILRVVTKSEMVTVGVNHERTLNQLLWQGNPSNNTAGGGYKEFPGFDLLITTGYADYSSGQLCPALDSDVKDFGYSMVGGADKDIVEYLAMLEYYLTYNAEAMGLDPATWVIAMRPPLWQELSAVWPCRYLTNRCTVIDTANIDTVPQVDASEAIKMRDAMRNGMYIDINGKRYPVVTDTGIFEHNSTNNANLAAGEFASSIYMVPLTITGGFPVTYLEHVDYTAAAPDIELLRGKETFWTDDGRFFWAYVDTEGFCYKLKSKTEPRLVLRTPQLAGRIDYVGYSPLQHVREPDPDSAYYYDGGLSLRPDPDTSNQVWSGVAPR